MRKPRKGEKIECAYLYSDGHLIVCWQTSIRVAGSSRIIRYAESIEQFSRCTFTGGRIVISSGGLLPALEGARVMATEPCVLGGSQNTRDMGLAVGTVSWENQYGWFHTSQLHVLSSGLTYQPNICETFNEHAETWGHDDEPLTVVRSTKPRAVLA